MTSDPDLTSLVDALRADLPNEHDSARLRARLSMLGIAAGASVTGSAAAAAGAGLAPSAALAATTAAANSAPGINAALAASPALGSGVAQASGWAVMAKLAVIATASPSVVAGPLWYVNTRVVSAPAASSSVAQLAADRGRASASGRELENGRARAGSELGLAAPDDGVASSPSPAASARDVALSDPNDDQPTRADDDSVQGAPLAAGSLPSSGRASASPAMAGPSASALTLEPASSVASDEPRGSASAAAFDSEPRPSLADRTTLREETELIDGALSALSASNTTRAAALLAEHARRFPNGLLSRERARAERKLRMLQGKP